MNVVIGVGAGRCGTRSLAMLAAKAGDEHTTAAHEPEPRLIDLAVRRTVSNERLDTWLRPNDVQALLQQREQLTRGAQTYVEVAVWWSFLIPYAERIWPGVKVIWLERQLWPWARSAYRRGWYHENSKEADRETEFWKLRFEPARGWPDSVDQWFKIAWYYWTVHYQIERDLAATKVDWVRYPCEALDDLPRLNAMLHWAGLAGPVETPERLNTGDTYMTLKEVEATGKKVVGAFAGMDYLRVPRHSVEPALGPLRDQDAYPLTNEVFDSLAAGTHFASLTRDEPLRMQKE